MEFKGTPGPWVIDEWSMTGINSESKHVALVNYSHHGLPNDVYGDEHEANANLIAAAPELLEALIEIRKLVAHHDKADLAIAKALGQQ
ncbi:hypothetical protein [Providencia sp. PROV113]|uniref:hypothetical protein n=1 Tax=Providencia sp. PROV113 TaxID=2949824 RepID=UPI002348F9A4|nr:hypothetical protein [Providencia sp. PROV113]